MLSGSVRIRESMELVFMVSCIRLFFEPAAVNIAKLGIQPVPVVFAAYILPCVETGCCKFLICMPELTTRYVLNTPPSWLFVATCHAQGLLGQELAELDTIEPVSTMTEQNGSEKIAKDA